MDEEGNMGVERKILDADIFGPASIAHRRAGLKTAGERKVSAVRGGSASKGASERKDRAHQYRASNQNKQPHYGLLSLCSHHAPLFTAVQRPGWRCSSVSICK